MVLGTVWQFWTKILCAQRKKNQKHTEVLSFSKVCCMCECGGKKLIIIKQKTLLWVKLSLKEEIIQLQSSS